jgi:UDP-N-acetylglucosamine:LPS N-acetylglucosamine transferase
VNPVASDQAIDVDFIFFDAGGGHRSAATALQAVVQQSGRPWNVRMVNLQQVMEPVDIFRKYTGVDSQDVYNGMLRRGWTYGSPQILKVIHGLIRVFHRKQVKAMRAFYRQSYPKLVVSLVPNFNRAIFQALQAEHPNTPYVTILTDMADYPPHFWMEKQAQHFICGTQRAVDQAVKLGIPSSAIHPTSGMILRPSFYDLPPLDRTTELEKLGFDSQVPTGLILFGGEGSFTMKRIVERIDRDCQKPVQLIALCGKNKKLLERLQNLPVKRKLHAVGFTSEIPKWMRISDFFIGKPGPGSISEALAMGLPVIIERNWNTMPQERFNTKWVETHGYGMVLKSFSKVGAAVDELLSAQRLEQYQKKVAGYQNRAVFEIPEILDRILTSRKSI